MFLPLDAVIAIAQHRMGYRLIHKIYQKLSWTYRVAKKKQPELALRIVKGANTRSCSSFAVYSYTLQVCHTPYKIM